MDFDFVFQSFDRAVLIITSCLMFPMLIVLIGLHLKNYRRIELLNFIQQLRFELRNQTAKPDLAEEFSYIKQGLIRLDIADSEAHRITAHCLQFDPHTDTIS